MTTGDILIADLDPVVGHEQGGRRPVVVVSSQQYSVIPGLFLAIPLTTTDRGLRHHVAVPPGKTTGLDRNCYAMPEQIRALAHKRIHRQLGILDDATIRKISRYLRLFIT
jgi:mRNA interferase MazF